MEQVWFELRDVRGRKLEGSVWIPLRSIHTRLSTGKSGWSGYKEEFFGAGSLAVFKNQRDEAEKLGWMDVGISHEHAGHVHEGRYCPSDVYDLNTSAPIGLHLVLCQRITGEGRDEWHLHQDIVLALRLKREGDVWISPDEGYIEVARLRRSENEKPYLLEIRASHLKDYLCARGDMALYVTSYWNREEVVDDPSDIDWPDHFVSEEVEGDRWEGRVIPIHEGGFPFGEEVAVFHVARTDVDTEEDVPKFERPSDEDVESRSWTKKHTGKKIFRVQGELWRNEWVEPGASSPRVRWDQQPPSVFFVTDAAGKLESRDTLQDGSRWLWFRPDVMMALAHRRGGALRWYTRDTGAIRCSPSCDVHFGVNSIGLINVYAKDIALLPDWQQRIWAGHNIEPDGRVSEELLEAQMKATPASTKAPEAFLGGCLQRLNESAIRIYGFGILREHEHRSHLLSVAHRFRAVDEAGLFALAKDLARLTADSFDTAAMQRIVAPQKGENRWGSLRTLEELTALHVEQELARNVVGALVGVYELRHPDAHLPSSDLSEAYRLARIDNSQPLVFQGYQLLDTCVSAICFLARMLERDESS